MDKLIPAKELSQTLRERDERGLNNANLEQLYTTLRHQTEITHKHLQQAVLLHHQGPQVIDVAPAPQSHLVASSPQSHVVPHTPEQTALPPEQTPIAQGEHRQTMVLVMQSTHTTAERGASEKVQLSQAV